jgi:hypothetical protein
MFYLDILKSDLRGAHVAICGGAAATWVTVCFKTKRGWTAP